MIEEDNFRNLCDLTTSLVGSHKGSLSFKSRKQKYQVPRCVASVVARMIDETHPTIIAKVIKRDRVSIWHYEKMKKGYPSVKMFIKNGFRVLPCSWKEAENALALIEESYKQKSPKMLGHCFTTWGAIQNKKLPKFSALAKGMEKIHKL